MSLTRATSSGSCRWRTTGNRKSKKWSFPFDPYLRRQFVTKVTTIKSIHVTRWSGICERSQTSVANLARRRSGLGLPHRPPRQRSSRACLLCQCSPSLRALLPPRTSHSSPLWSVSRRATPRSRCGSKLPARCRCSCWCLARCRWPGTTATLTPPTRAVACTAASSHLATRSTPRALIWRRTSALILARSRTSAPGRAASGASPGRTSWRGTTASTPARSRSAAATASAASRAPTTWRCTPSATRSPRPPSSARRHGNANKPRAHFLLFTSYF